MKALLLVCMFALVWMPVFAGYYDYREHSYLSFLSANTYSVSDNNADIKDATTGFSTNNKALLNLKYFGISAEYYRSVFKFGEDGDRRSHTASSVGVGVGMPDPDFLKLFASYHLDMEDSVVSESSTAGDWLHLEAAKRFHSSNMCSGLSLNYISYEQLGHPDFVDILPGLFGAPNNYNQDRVHNIFNVKAFASSVTEELQEPVSGLGIAPEDYPLLLIDRAAIAIYLDYERINHRDNDGFGSKVNTDCFTAKLPMNLGRYYGLDLAYKYRTDDSDDRNERMDFDLTMRPVAISTGGFNLSLIANGSFTRYDDRYNDPRDYYYLNVGGIASLNVKNHLGLYARYLNNNDWDLENDASDIENKDFSVDAGIVLRY